MSLCWRRPERRAGGRIRVVELDQRGRSMRLLQPMPLVLVYHGICTFIDKRRTWNDSLALSFSAAEALTSLSGWHLKLSFLYAVRISSFVALGLMLSIE